MGDRGEIKKNVLITDSVGNAAKNLPNDVKTVKSLVLRILPPYNVAPTDAERKQIDASSPICEPALIAYLTRFQRMVVPAEASSGGRVQPMGQTIQKLRAYADGSDSQKAGALSKSPSISLPNSPAEKVTETLTLRDVRLKGWRPKGVHVLEVDEDTPIAWAIGWVVRKSDEFGALVNVRIMAHGKGQKTETKKSFSWEEKKFVDKGIYSQGGAGIQFCSENINGMTLPLFAAWKGKVKAIDLLSCGVAYITPDHAGTRGDGNYLCSRFAQVTGATVRASTATQLYYPNGSAGENAIDFGSWEGTVITYGPSGSVIHVEQGKSASTSMPR